MGIEKSEIKESVYREIGVHIEESLEAIERDVYQERGAALYLRDQALKLSSIVAAVDTAMNTNAPDAPPDLETAKLIKAWVGKCILAVKNASESCHNRDLLGQGKLSQLKEEHSWLLKQREVMRAREARLAEETATNPDVILDSDGDPVYVGDGAAPMGVRMGNREEKATHAAKKEVAQVEPAKPAVEHKKRKVKRNANTR